MMNPVNAIWFIEELKQHQSDAEVKKIRRYFKYDDAANKVIGVRMKTIFELSEHSLSMSLSEIEKLLESPFYEARMGAVSIMDFQVRGKEVTKEYRKARFDLYLNRHDRLNSWDFMDRAAPRVIGSYLYDYEQPRKILYQLARSDNPWERRTAIVSTGWFIRKGELDDTFQIAEILLDDGHEFVQKAVGTWVRHAGKQDEKRLLQFLEKHASEIRPATLTIMIEKLDQQKKEYYRRK